MEETYSAVTTEPIIISDEVAARRKALFDKYVTPYNRMIYKLCMRYTFNPSDIEDNYIEVLTNMYKYIETYNPERSVQTWLHIVTKRCVFDLDQRKKKHQDMLSDDNDVETFSSSESIVDFDEVSSNVMGIDNYQELYRSALLYQQAGYKLKEIAEIEYRNGALESRNIETVKSRLFLARQQLQQLLTRDGKRRTTDETD